MDASRKKQLINRMLDPECIAVIGATPENMWTRNLLGGLEREGYRGEIFTVNRGRGKVLGYPCFHSVAELPKAPDLAMILLSEKYVFATLKELADKGCASAYVLAAGYEEAEKLAELRQVAEELGILILGPNCNGYVRPDSGLHCWGGPIPRPYKAGSLAFIAQSSAVAGSAANSCWDRNLGFSAIITTGNQANFTLADCFDYLADDLDTRAIVCYIEQFGDFEAFANGVKRCRDAGKAIIGIATGKSQAARDATLSHTGALTAGPEVSAAALDALGIIAAKDTDDALDYASLFVQLPPRCWKDVQTVGVITPSGGYAALMADALDEHGLETPPLPQSVLDTLPAIVPHNNPMDLTATIFAWADQYPKVIDSFIVAEEFDAVVLMMGAWEGFERWFAPVTAWAYKIGKPVLLGGNEVFCLGDSLRTQFNSDPTPVVHGTARIARALSGMQQYHRLQYRLSDDWFKAPCKPWSGSNTVTFPDIAENLNAAGIKTVDWWNLSNAEKPNSGPLAVKLESPQLLHKSDHQAVLLGVETDAVADSTRQLQAIAKNLDLKNFQIIAQQMVSNGRLELLVGAVVDSTVGPVLTLSLGGITAELQKQVVHALCPFDRETARGLVESLQIMPLFEGYRGQPPLDDSLFELLVKVSQWVYDHRDRLKELDLNPVFVPNSGSPALVGDALAIFS
ncbi:MAG: acetate--CoA ligase family protein [Immundisolibacteraceae bacterium]|nr:acetate--CoA ligase family protein [Immundisolibacteraceae bacterium]